MVLFSSDRIALKLINYSKLSGRVKRTLFPRKPLQWWKEGSEFAFWPINIMVTLLKSGNTEKVFQQHLWSVNYWN